jgi:uncharacterized protein YndB with AHSA1/START domain
MKLIARASIQISKPVDEVFEGIVNDAAMTRYFISESSGCMETGKELVWKFAEFPDAFPVQVGLVEEDRLVSFVWEEDTVVEIRLEEQSDGSTVVRVTEDGKSYSEENLKWVIGNTEGWANFLACMKAYLEYGINLRKGAFDFLRIAE